MGKNKRNGSMREQMEGIAIAIAPMTIGKKRDKKMKGGKPAKTSYTYSEGGRATYAKGGKGIEALRKEAPEVVARMGYEEGGEMDSQMAMAMPMPMEETETPMSEEQPLMPDTEMEDEYLDFVISQSLNPEEEAVLMSKLEADPELSVMFDKLMDTATEFSGSGPVEGPGSEVSDSIPARLSDGEFVFTAKATEYIGADRLQSMMEEAQTAADAERQEVALGGVMTEKPQASLLGALPDGNINDDDIRKDMRSVNPRLQ